MIPEGSGKSNTCPDLRVHDHLYLDTYENKITKWPKLFFFLCYNFLIYNSKSKPTYLGDILLFIYLLLVLCLTVNFHKCLHNIGPRFWAMEVIISQPLYLPLPLPACQVEWQANTKPFEGNRGGFRRQNGIFSLGNKSRVVVRTHRRQELTRVDLPQAEPSLQWKLCLLGLWGLVCTTSQVRGLNLSKKKDIFLIFLK